MPKLILDPGHGGKDPGASGFGIKEADVVVKLAKLIAANLSKDEVEILLTRDTDTFVELPDRAKMSNDFGADYFVSTHINSATSAQANGFETYVWSGAGHPNRVFVHQQREGKRVAQARRLPVRPCDGLGRGDREGVGTDPQARS